MRAIRVVVGVLVLATLLAVVDAGTASAMPVRTSCEHWSSVGSNFQSGRFWGCSHKSSNGGAGTLTVDQQARTTAIEWANGATTGLADLGITQVTQDEPEHNVCPAGMQEFRWFGTVTGDTTGAIGVGGKLSGEVCIDFSSVASENEPYARVTFT
jgi:hypothetical protein